MGPDRDLSEMLFAQLGSEVRPFHGAVRQKIHDPVQRSLKLAHDPPVLPEVRGNLLDEAPCYAQQFRGQRRQQPGDLRHIL